MRVAVTVVSRTFSPAVARCAEMIAKGFAATGCESELIVAGDWKTRDDADNAAYRYTSFAKTHEQNGSQFEYLRYMRKMIRRKQWDVLLMYSVGLPFPLLISHARRHGVQVLYFQGDRWEGRSGMPIARRLKIAVINFINGYLARRADLITAGGSSLLKEHFRQVAPAVEVLQQWTPTDTDLFARGEGIAFRKKHRLEGRKLVVYAGAIHSLDGVDVLIKAMAQVCLRRDDATLVLAGKRPAEDILLEKAIDFEGLTKSLDLQDHVRFAGLLGLDDLRNLLHAADVLVMPKIDHQMNRVAAPIKLPEYLSSSRPVVATRVGDIEKYLADGQDAVLCKPGDSQDLADKILSVLHDPITADRIGANGARVAREQMDHRVWARRVLQKLGRE